MISATVSGNIRQLTVTLAARIQSGVNEAVKEYCAAVFDDLITQTPKLSGQATANWQVALGVQNDVFIQLPEAVRSATYDAADVADALLVGMSTIQSRQLGQVVFIFNNAPYIQRLNEGYSPQANAGFIDSILENRLRILQDASIL